MHNGIRSPQVLSRGCILMRKAEATGEGGNKRGNNCTPATANPPSPV